MRALDWWELAWRDTRYAALRLTREPLASSFVILTLALGFSANVTAFGLIDRILVRGPEHVRDPNRLVRLYRRVSDPGSAPKPRRGCRIPRTWICVARCAPSRGWPRIGWTTR